jgi:hypothetical protein
VHRQLQDGLAPCPTPYGCAAKEAPPQGIELAHPRGRTPVSRLCLNRGGYQPLITNALRYSPGIQEKPGSNQPKPHPLPRLCLNRGGQKPLTGNALRYSPGIQQKPGSNQPEPYPLPRLCLHRRGTTTSHREGSGDSPGIQERPVVESAGTGNNHVGAQGRRGGWVNTAKTDSPWTGWRWLRPQPTLANRMHQKKGTGFLRSPTLMMRSHFAVTAALRSVMRATYPLSNLITNRTSLPTLYQTAPIKRCTTFDSNPSVSFKRKSGAPHLPATGTKAQS